MLLQIFRDRSLVLGESIFVASFAENARIAASNSRKTPLNRQCRPKMTSFCSRKTTSTSTNSSKSNFQQKTPKQKIWLTKKAFSIYLFFIPFFPQKLFFFLDLFSFHSLISSNFLFLSFSFYFFQQFSKI